MPNLFNKKILNNRLKDFTVENIDEKIEKIKSWQQSLSKIKGLNEKRLQSAFLKAIFEDILGYENSPQKDEWTLDIEATTDVDAKHPDGILGFFERIDNEEIRGHEGVIELKGPQISLDKDQKRQGTTYKSPVDQAFSYTNKLDKCKWVIVSNFMEIRLYKVGRSKEYYEVFLLDELDEIENFKRFYYLLNKNNLLSKTGESVTYKLSEKTLKKEEDISVKFYNLYKDVRVNLFEHLKDNNSNKEPELLLEKAQKFLDRIIFIGFCEDKGLLPNDLLHEAIQRGKESFSPSNTAVWDQIKGVFRSIDEGNPAHNINAYNGGLFEYDDGLDGLLIENNFFEAIYKISDYDFDSDVDVNILGHIFEQSISDLEKLKSDIRDDEFDKSESKRKKDGIFYTPQYITSYIVENAIGGYLEDLKEELGYYKLPDIENAGSDSWETRYTNQHLEFYNKYEKKLKEIKILDPACGSGAFLNQAFDYLLEEHNWLNKQRDLLKGGQSSIFALDAIQRNILKNNIYGVDLNEESVEITKLSLWLKTANKYKPLTNLDDNIKCGNSLIDDPEVARNKAFDWKKKFKNIMASGGFDIIIGNPPYGVTFNEEEKKILEKFDPLVPDYAIYIYFISKGLELLKDDGFLSYIFPNTFLSNIYGKKYRVKIIDNYNIKEIVNLSNDDTFEDASVRTCIFTIKDNFDPENKIVLSKIKSKNNIIEYKKYKKEIINKNIENWLALFNNSFEIEKIIDKIKTKSVKLEKVFEVSQGLIPYDKYVGHSEETIKNRIWHSDFKKDETYKKELKGGDVERYFIKWNGERWISYGDWLASPRKPKYFQEPRVLIREITSDKLMCSFTEKEFYNSPSIINIISRKERYEEKKKDLKYLLGILNSKLINWYHFHTSPKAKKGLFPKIVINDVRNIPVLYNLKTINDLYSLVNDMLNFKKDIYKKRQIEFTNFKDKYVSLNNTIELNSIIERSNFVNEIYSGRAKKIRNYFVNINSNIITVYLEKSSNGKYEVIKFEENDRYKREYIKYYLENLTDHQLKKIDDSYSGNILSKTLQIKFPDYNKEHIIKKVVKEWNSLQQEINNLENKIEKIDNEIDQMVYKRYDLTEEEIKIVENS